MTGGTWTRGGGIEGGGEKGGGGGVEGGGGVFFFQAEDGIRDYDVTGVQTCALPIFGYGSSLDCYSPRWELSAAWYPVSPWQPRRTASINSAQTTKPLSTI